MSAQYVPDVASEPVGARKFDGGKARFDLLDWESITDLARVMTMGAAKYDDRNYLGLEPHRVRASLARHVAEIMIQAQTLPALPGMEPDLALDEESGLPHLAHVMANCMMLMEMARHRMSRDVADGMIEAMRAAIAEFVEDSDEVQALAPAGTQLIVTAKGEATPPSPGLNAAGAPNAAARAIEKVGGVDAIVGPDRLRAFRAYAPEADGEYVVIRASDEQAARAVARKEFPKLFPHGFAIEVTGAAGRQRRGSKEVGRRG